MSEKIYSWLLRLFPARFREKYEDEALQLFRDRCRNERGILPAVRLWLDLLLDLAASVPRTHRRAQTAWFAAPAQPRTDGVPSFIFLQSEAPSVGALLLGALLSVCAVGVSAALQRLEGHRPITAWVFQPTDSAAQSAPNSSVAGAAFEPSQPPASSAVGGTAVSGTAERDRVLRAVIANVEQYYVAPEVAKKIAAELHAQDRKGGYGAVTDPAVFAALLTLQMRNVSHDPNLEVVYSQSAIPDRPSAPTPESAARYREAALRENCSFEKVAILAGNVGYIKLNAFANPNVCAPSAAAAMQSVNRADALIFDLRDNRGGFPDMVMLLSSYLFDHPEYMYNPRENTSESSWTQPVDGSHLTDKPLYILTSARTASAAEHFSYDLKMLKRATLVGETTRGSAHAGRFHRIDSHFGVGIPEVKPINPFSKTDWAGVGVQPDVKADAADSLAVAENLAHSRVHRRH